MSLASDPLGPGHAAALAAGVDPSDLAGRHVLRFCSPLLATLANCLGNTCFTPKRAVQCLPLFLSLLLLLPSPVLRVLCLPVNACVPSVCHRRAAPHSPALLPGACQSGQPWAAGPVAEALDLLGTACAFLDLPVVHTTTRTIRTHRKTRNTQPQKPSTCQRSEPTEIPGIWKVCKLLNCFMYLCVLRRSRARRWWPVTWRRSWQGSRGDEPSSAPKSSTGSRCRYHAGNARATWVAPWKPLLGLPGMDHGLLWCSKT